MKFQKRRSLSARDIQLFILIGLILFTILGSLIGADIQLSRMIPGGAAFYAPWIGAREFLYNHLGPYGAQVQQLTDQLANRAVPEGGERPSYVTIPFFLLITYFPIAVVSDAVPHEGVLVFLNVLSEPASARGIWLFLSEAALVGTALLSLRLIDWKPNRIFQVAYALLSVFGFYTVIALLDGSPAVLLGLIYIAVLFAYTNQQDELAGALLVLGLFAWEVGGLFVLMLLWNASYHKRGRVWAGLGMMLSMLLLISFIIYPGWLLPYLGSTLAAMRASFGVTSHAALNRLWPANGVRASQALTVVLIVMLFYEWSVTRNADARRFVWAACLTLAATPLLGVRTELGNLTVLFPCLGLIFAGVVNRWRAGYWLATLLLLIAFLVPWAWFSRWLTSRDQRWQDYLLLFLPAFSVIGLYWTRWWFVRPPRTWYDHVRGTLSATQRLANSRQSTNSGG